MKNQNFDSPAPDCCASVSTRRSRTRAIGDAWQPRLRSAATPGEASRQSSFGEVASALHYRMMRTPQQIMFNIKNCTPGKRNDNLKRHDPFLGTPHHYWNHCNHFGHRNKGKAHPAQTIRSADKHSAPVGHCERQLIHSLDMAVERE